MINLYNILTHRIGKKEIGDICMLLHGNDNDYNKDTFYKFIFDSNKRVAENATWILTHLKDSDITFMYFKYDELVEESMKTTSETKRRLLLNIILRIPLYKEKIRTDFLDFCMNNIMNISAPVATRALYIKLSYNQCKFYMELLFELKNILEIMVPEFLSPALKCTRKSIIKEISRDLNR